MEEKFLNPKDVAKLLSLYPQSLANWRCKGKNLPYAKIGRAVRYSLQDVIKFAESRKVKIDG